MLDPLPPARSPRVGDARSGDPLAEASKGVLDPLGPDGSREETAGRKGGRLFDLSGWHCCFQGEEKRDSLVLVRDAL